MLLDSVTAHRSRSRIRLPIDLGHCGLFDFRPGIAQGHNSVEYRLPRFRIDLIGDEVTETLKLKKLTRLTIPQRGFKAAVCGNGQRVRIQKFVKVLAIRITAGIRDRE